LLHLAGFNDVTVQQQKQMQRLQNRLLATALRANRQSLRNHEDL
jgi:ssRNA-specific RNase YbeY (16S rRNA maturation enzyme)